MKSSALRALAAFCTLSSLLSAQAPVVSLIGDIWDGNGGPFVSGTVYHVKSTSAACCMRVPSGKTLTIQPGAIVKIDTSISVQGSLNAKGAVFTSWLDDTVGGDSNADGGLTSPARGDWDVIELGATALFEDCKVRYGGQNFASVHLRGGTLVMRRCTIEHSQFDALLFNENNGTVVDTKFRFCGGYALNGVALSYVTQLSGNTATGCDTGDYARITGGLLDAPTGTTVLDRRHSFNQSGIFVIDSGHVAIDVLQGARLVAPKGTILKMAVGIVWAQDDLMLQGTAVEPVVLTSLKDDSFGGDTNKDGNSTVPAPGDWGGIQLQPGSGASRIQGTIVRYGGGSGGSDAGIGIYGVGAEVRDSVIDSNKGAGVFFSGAYTGHPRLVGCLISNNTTVAAKDIPWQSLALSSRNTTSGNQGGDHFSLLPDSPLVPIEIGPPNYPGDVLVVIGSTILGSGGEMDILAGTQIKFTQLIQSGFDVNPGGALRVHGTAAKPVVMTSIHDDTIGGDTNRNGGATLPQAGQWRWLYLGDDRVTSPSRLENLVLRYAGGGGSDAVVAGNSKLTMRSVRIDHSGGRAVNLTKLAGPLVNLMVWGAANEGIRIGGGSNDIVHATVVGCGGVGVEEVDPSYSGVIRNSVVWNNSGGNFGGSLPGAKVRNCNGGFAGSRGNINQSPQFVSAASGDFHLSASSPCINRGDLVTALAVAKDHDENSRVLDSTFSGASLPDMGAYERTAYRLLATGEPRINTTMTFKVSGPSGLSTVFLGLLDGGFFLSPFGVELAGSTLFFLTASPVQVGQSVVMTIPNMPGLVGLNFGVQGLALPQSSPGRGAFSNLYRGRLR